MFKLKKLSHKYLILGLSIFTVTGIAGRYWWSEQVTAQSLTIPQVETTDAVLNDQKISDFVKSGYEFAVKLYGQPRIPVNTVNLRLHTSAMTSLNDANQGIFTIYLGRRPNEYSFYGQLAHEVAHLLNARLFDCYAEGLGSLFAERMLLKNGLDWSGWVNYYKQGGDPMYAATYFMMKDVSEAAGAANMKKLLSFAVKKPGAETMYIDINAWLNSMSADSKEAVAEAINQNSAQVQAGLAKQHQGLLTCEQPKN
jgi:hypothetical protein